MTFLLLQPNLFPKKNEIKYRTPVSVHKAQHCYYSTPARVGRSSDGGGCHIDTVHMDPQPR